jgi:hypothetical protein
LSVAFLNQLKPSRCSVQLETGGTCSAALYVAATAKRGAMLQGSPTQLADMCAWLSEGMSAALVDELEVTRRAG